MRWQAAQRGALFLSATPHLINWGRVDREISLFKILSLAPPPPHHHHHHHQQH
jgi:hypothetical protein